MKWFSSSFFSLYRMILGTYLFFHFSKLLNDGNEIFSNEGVISDVSILPSYGKLPILLFHFDSPRIVELFIGSLIICSILFTVGIYRRLSSLWLFYGWMSLLNRNPLISNPSIGYIGWILLSCALIPKGEKFLFFRKRKEETADSNNEFWEMPDIIYYGFWIILGVSYTASGLHKLSCDNNSWIDGTALYYVLTGPLARPNNLINELLVSNLFLIKLLTWGSLALELSYLFIGTFYRTRKYYWLASMAFHMGIICTVNFTDLTVGMIVAHLFSFDPSWFQWTRALVIQYDRNGSEIIEFDYNHTDKFNSKPISENVVNELNTIRRMLFEKASLTQNTITTRTSELLKEGLKDDKTKNTFISWITVAIIVGSIGIFINAKGGLIPAIYRMAELSIKSHTAFMCLIIILGIIMILERIFPDQQLKPVEGWWKWVIIINMFQLFSAILAIFTWEQWLQNTSYFKSTVGFHLRDYASPFWSGVIAYFVNQWLFYHWHKARHEVYLFWILFHQFHHSASRIEAITSFYKHPFEIIIDSQIMAILSYSVLGIDSQATVWLSVFSAIGEYLYHMNIHTPRILGYVFQRSVSHRCHHRYMKRLNCPNYSDFPIFDILGGTFENPEYCDEPCGFTPNKEIQRLNMIFFKDVLFGCYQDIFSSYKKLKGTIIRYLCYALVLWGALNSTAFIAHNSNFKEVGFVTVSSPLPLVFSSYNGIQTFVTAFNATINYQNGTQTSAMLDVNRYNLLSGSYNRRNVYGAVFSHGPFFNNDILIKIRQEILQFAVCKPGKLLNEFGFPGIIKKLHIDVLNRHDGNRKIGELNVVCIHPSVRSFE